MKKNDLILFCLIIFFSILAFFLIGRNQDPGDKKLDIYVGNSLFGTYDLDTDKEIDINDSNICIIKDGKVSMKWADCPDKICVDSHEIEKIGESIICIPNRVSLVISGDQDNDYDTPVK